MKTPNFLLTVILIGLFSPGYAQQSDRQQQPAEITAIDDDLNIAKINLLALPLRSFSLQYERIVARKISLAFGVGIIPRGGFPLLGSFESYIGDEETFNQLKDARVGSTAVTASSRFYFGKHDGPRGFYIAPYLRYSTYGLSLDEYAYTITVETESGTYEETRNIALSGRVNGFTGGVLFGAQWRVAKRLYLDWWILGAAYGTANGKLDGAAALSSLEQQGLRESLDELEIPMVKTTATVNANGGRLDMNGPWAGIRSGLALGINF